MGRTLSGPFLFDCCLRRKSSKVPYRAVPDREAFVWQLISSLVLGDDLPLRED